MTRLLCVVAACLLCSPILRSAEPLPSAGDALVTEYFRLETDRIERRTEAELPTLVNPAVREEHRRQLRDMLGLDPLPPRTPLNAMVTGTVDHPEFTVEKLHFQSSPGLYVTGNLYVPKGLKEKVPAILYVCGHSLVKKNGISYGNKTGYQHHGAWFARNGYVCLVIDTLQLGEIEGIHHGLHREGRWWWLARGYTPAGVEAWNCIRSLDYLQSRPEVDGSKIGVTGRSGGGAYTWWIAGVDDRVQVAVPVAGITSRHNHIVDGTIAGHCDCMFHCNTQGWDDAMIASLFAPKPLLISNTDKDNIFPLDGVVATYMKARGLYRALGQEDKIGLQITEGPHKDTQELHIHAFVWMNRFLKGDNPVIDKPAVKFFEPEQLRVFDQLPKDEINTRIDQTFVPMASAPPVPSSSTEWTALRDGWLRGLSDKTFHGWPGESPSVSDLAVRQLSQVEKDGLSVAEFEFTSQQPYRLSFWVVRDSKATASRIHVEVLNEESGRILAQVLPSAPENLRHRLQTTLQSDFLGEPGTVGVFLFPRGVGKTAWSSDTKTRTQIRRRFALLGQTDDGMRVWDVKCGLEAIRATAGLQGLPVTLCGQSDAAVWALYAAIFGTAPDQLRLIDPPLTHADGPNLLSVLRVLDVPQALALAADRTDVTIEVRNAANAPVGDFAKDVAHLTGRKVTVKTQSKP